MTDTNISPDTIEAASELPEEIPMRILRVATCPSLSGRSELTYHIGVNDHNAIHFRLWGNTGSGMFSTTWFSLKDVSELLSAPEGITSSALQPLWASTSRNNPGFTLAIMLGEGLVEKSPIKQNTYCAANPSPFLQRINALIASGVNLDPDDVPSEEHAIAATEAPKRGRPKKQSA